MIEFLLSAPTLVGSIASMILATLSGLVVYVISYKLIFKYQSSDLKDPTGNPQCLTVIVSH
jgi:hypothetical protein